MNTKTKTKDPNRPKMPAFAAGNDHLVYVEFKGAEHGFYPVLRVDGPRGGRVLVASAEPKRLRRFAESIIANLDYTEAQRAAAIEEGR